MGKRQFDTDPSGMKLYGRCKHAGRCICGRCAEALINRENEGVTITRVDPATLNQLEKFNRKSALATLPEPKTITVEKPKPEKPARFTLADPLEPEPAEAPPVRAHGNIGRRRSPESLAKYHETMRRKREEKLDRGAAENGPVVVAAPISPAPVEEKGPTIPPEPEKPHTAAQERPDIPVMPPKPSKIVELKDLQHEVTIKLAGVEITIRPIKEQS